MFFKLDPDHGEVGAAALIGSRGSILHVVNKSHETVHPLMTGNAMLGDPDGVNLHERHPNTKHELRDKKAPAIPFLDARGLFAVSVTWPGG